MKVINQFHLIGPTEVDLDKKLIQLEHSIKLARQLIDLNLMCFRDPEPLKFLEHDYDLVIGNFGIDFLHRQSASRAGNQTDSPAVSGSSANPLWSEPGATIR